MIKIDTIKILVGKEAINFIDEERFTRQERYYNGDSIVREDLILPKEYKPQGLHGLVIKDFNGREEMIIELSAKILQDRYPEVVQVFFCTFIHHILQSIYVNATRLDFLESKPGSL